MSNYSNVVLSDDPNTPWYRIFAYIEPQSRVLDVGCSAGNFGKALIDQKKCMVDGIEVNKQDSIKAKKKLMNVYNINIENTDFKNLPGDYRYIYFGDVIEHLVDPVSVLKKITKLLSKDGEILFSIPNMAHLSVRLMLLSGEFNYAKTGLLDNTHLHFYTFKEIERVFNEAGYEIVYQKPIIKEYPRKLLAKELKKVGLKGEETFFKRALNSDAVVWQYVGAARRSNTPKEAAVLPAISPGLEFEELYATTAQECRDIILENKQLQEQYQTALKVIRQKNKELHTSKNLPYFVMKKIKNRLKST